MQLLVAENDVSDLTVSSHGYELKVENRLAFILLVVQCSSDFIR